MRPRDRGIGGGSVGAFVVAILIVTGGIGSAGAFLDGPLLYYDARPAYVGEADIASSEYRLVNATDFAVGISPIPFVRAEARTWVSVYATGIEEPETEGENATIDVRNGSVAAVFSMSALQLGPISFNPLVYGSDPRVLAESGVLLERGKTYLPENVTAVSDLTVRSDRRVTMLGRQERMTTFTGTVVLSNDSNVDVRLYLARALRDGELVVTMGIAPASADGSADQFATLVETVRMGEWGERPPQPERAGGSKGIDSRRPDGCPKNCKRI